jgi:hypothetical protein
LEFLQATTSLLLKGSPPELPALHAYPRTEAETVAVAVPGGHSTMSFLLHIALKMGKPVFPGSLDGVPGPAW